MKKLDVATSSRVNLKVLDVLWQLVCDGQLFFGVSVVEYEDWGSKMAWEAHKSRGREKQETESCNEVGWGEWLGGLVGLSLKS